jgi:hypothetical protein
MEKTKQKLNIKIQDNFFVIEPQELIKQWNQTLKHPQTPNIDTTTL